MAGGTGVSPWAVARDSKALERFKREARAASSLDYSNTCTIHEFGEYQGHPFIAEALLEGQTVRDRMASAVWKFGLRWQA